MVTAVQPAARPLALPGETPRIPRISARHLGPNWYAPVMGTAIVGTAGGAFAGGTPALHAAAVGVWALSALLLAVVLTARAVHWTRHRDQARAHLDDPAVAPFYGCLSMALLAVGAGAAGTGHELLGGRAALTVAAVLFVAGTVIGLVVAVAVPYLMVVRHRVAPGSASPVWLLPVVAPMVSASSGPLLVPHLPAGQWREALLLASYALFGVSLLATLLILPVVFARLLHHGPLPLALTPALFLVLGPLGQSTTAVNKLADVAPGAISAPYAHGLGALAVVYGVPVMGFALLWLALAGAMVVRAFRAGMPFTMGWWAFTFPVGTCATGAQTLEHHTGLAAYGWLAVTLYALLTGAWAVASVLTVRGLVRGELLAAPRR
ncbi:TDT family transporter [Streptomyces sp. t39]|uniref:TDT family transporter n=1 Tax=Streptomyces sp. t39 TaxID=1828156 RepID=UPI0011CD8B35|nr:TDT family transporter [Streptomyces sp. t39]TXS51326.1 C4-dicarboxylate ABC transporter [Streptomyces sp. t39]